MFVCLSVCLSICLSCRISCLSLTVLLYTALFVSASAWRIHITISAWRIHITISVFGLSFFSLFCSVPCARLSWLLSARGSSVLFCQCWQLCQTATKQGIAPAGGETICPRPPMPVRLEADLRPVSGRVRSPHISVGRRSLS